MAYRSLSVFAGLLFVILFQEQVYCDGCFIWRNKEIDILQPSQKAIIEWDGKTEKLTIQTKYQGPIEEMVWIVPVPAKPEVSKAHLEKFEELSKQTQTVTFNRTFFPKELIAMAPSRAASGPLIDRKKVGVYDVAILEPQKDEAVLKWLLENQFPINEAAAKQIADYDSRNWYIIASRIPVESQTALNQEQLSEGTLHPLCVSFETDRCVYPMQMTSLAAGPVEVLIWIQAEHHYQPDTLLSPDWEITLHGYRHLTTRESRNVWQRCEYDTSSSNECITKLRRTFDPKTITEDLYLRKMEYIDFFDPSNEQKVGMAASQMGLCGESRTVPLLSRYLMTAKIEDQPYLRSVIWALGQCVKNGEMPSDVEKFLLNIAKTDSTELGLECCVALEKAGCTKLAPIIFQHLINTTEYTLNNKDSIYAYYYDDEIQLFLDWIHIHNESVKNDYVELLANKLKHLSDAIQNANNAKLPIPIDEQNEWLFREVINTHDHSLIEPLSDIHERLLNGNYKSDGMHAIYLADRVLIAKVACHDEEATSALLQWMEGEANENNKLFSDDEQDIDDKHSSNYMFSFRNKSSYDTMHNLFIRYSTKTEMAAANLPSDSLQELGTHMLANATLNDWTTLYYLGWLTTPSEIHVERLKNLWETSNKNANGEIFKKLIVEVAGYWNETDFINNLSLNASQLDTKKRCLNKLIDINPALAVSALDNIAIMLNDKYAALNIYHHERNIDSQAFNYDIEIGFEQSIAHGMTDENFHAAYKRLCTDKAIHPATRFYLLNILGFEKYPWASQIAEQLYDNIAPTASSEDRMGLIRLLGYTGCVSKMMKEWELTTNENEKDELTTLIILKGGTEGAKILDAMLRDNWLKQYESITDGNYKLLINRLIECIVYVSDVAQDILERAEYDEKLPLVYRACLVSVKPVMELSHIKELTKSDIPEEIRTRLLNTIKEYESNNR